MLPLYIFVLIVFLLTFSFYGGFIPFKHFSPTEPKPVVTMLAKNALKYSALLQTWVFGPQSCHGASRLS